MSSQRLQEAEESAKCLRWRKVAMDHLSYALNLFLTSAVAALGFCFTLLKDKDFILPSCATRGAMFLSMLAFFGSGVFAYLCVVYRYNDFYETARRACGHPKRLTQDEVREIDEKVLNTFRWTVWAFGTGAISLAATLLLTYKAKLFP